MNEDSWNKSSELFYYTEFMASKLFKVPLLCNGGGGREKERKAKVSFQKSTVLDSGPFMLCTEHSYLKK
jgi:hypothetical protein